MWKPTAIDLFSGCGGLTLGLKQAGFKVTGAIDNDPLAVITYKKNHPRVVVWEKDVRRVTAKEVKKRLKLRKGELDLLAGCPPCQSFSAIRNRNGGRRIRDKKTKDLVFAFVRFAKELKPKAIMMENVPGLAADVRIRRLRRKLEALGYKCQYKVLDAADYGVPQRRRRLIFLAGLGRKVEFARPSSERLTVREAIGKLLGVGMSGDPLHDIPEKRSKKVLEIIRKVPKNGGSRLDLGKGVQLECHRRCNGFKDVYGRMAWDDVAPTITGGCWNPSKGRFLHPDANRAMTLREAALLQSFPPGYFVSLRRGKGWAAKMIGNALPPDFVRRHAVSVAESLARI